MVQAPARSEEESPKQSGSAGFSAKAIAERLIVPKRNPARIASTANLLCMFISGGG
ncbi:MAG: hypothetical protein ACRD97_02305 [Nitrososphaeraceae archaeon]